MRPTSLRACDGQADGHEAIGVAGRLARLTDQSIESGAMDLNGISAIVTGGASGLGEATVRALADRGARCVVVDMNPDKGEAVAKDVGGVFALADVANVEQVIAAVEAAKELGPLRALVTAAGIGWATRTIGRDGQYESAHDLEVFKKVLEVNLVGTFNCIRLAATAMSQNEAFPDNEKGAIVTVASVAAFEAPDAAELATYDSDSPS